MIALTLVDRKFNSQGVLLVEADTDTVKLAVKDHHDGKYNKILERTMVMSLTRAIADIKDFKLLLNYLKF